MFRVPSRSADKGAVKGIWRRLYFLEPLTATGRAPAVVRVLDGCSVVSLSQGLCELYASMQRAPAPIRLGILVVQRPCGVCGRGIVTRVCGDGCEAKMRPGTPSRTVLVG